MQNVLVKPNATISDTIALILSRVNRDVHSNTVKLLAASLNPKGDKVEFMHRLFDWVCRQVKYELDQEGNEVVGRPCATITDGKGDCKKMTVLIASVLKAVGINPLIKHVFYKNEDFTHVFVIVPWPALPNYIVIDPVNDCRWNTEVNYDSANVFDLSGNRMDLYTRGKPNGTPMGFKDHTNMAANTLLGSMQTTMGCGCSTSGISVLDEVFSDDSTISGIGRKSKAERKENRKKIVDKFKSVVKKEGFAVVRIPFLGLVRINAMKLASKLAQGWAKDKKKIEDTWLKFGGNVNELKQTIAAGAHAKLSGSMGIAVEAAAAAALPAITAFMLALKQLGVLHDGDKDTEVMEETVGDAEDNVAEGNISVDPTDPKHPVNNLPKDQGDQNPPPDDTSPNPTQGNFSTLTIDTWHDALLFIRSTGIYGITLGMIAAALHIPHPAIFMQLIFTSALAFACRSHIKKFFSKLFRYGR